MPHLPPTAVHPLDNHAGWRLELKVWRNRRTLEPGRRPLVLVPGYAMNDTPLAYHPGGPSLIEHLVAAGFEVWVAHLRGQGGARPAGRPARFGIGELALDDLPLIWDAVLAETATGADRLDPIGCSLGATLVYAYLAHHPTDHPFGAVVALGGPLRWDGLHPLLRLAFASPRLAGLVRVRHTRALAHLLLPVLRRMPSLLSVYLNADHIDLSAADVLVDTVEDPIPAINVEIAQWIRDVDLTVRGVNVSEGIAMATDVDVLSVYANRDGIVPPDTARAIAHILGAERATLLEVGAGTDWYAHADLFVGRTAREAVFEPVTDWLLERA